MLCLHDVYHVQLTPVVDTDDGVTDSREREAEDHATKQEGCQTSQAGVGGDGKNTDPHHSCSDADFLNPLDGLHDVIKRRACYDPALEEKAEGEAYHLQCAQNGKGGVERGDVVHDLFLYLELDFKELLWV